MELDLGSTSAGFARLHADTPGAGVEAFARLSPVLADTRRRYAERTVPRQATLARLTRRGVTPLDLDDPARVRRRLQRLGLEPREGARFRAWRGVQLQDRVDETLPSLTLERVLGKSDL